LNPLQGPHTHSDPTINEHTEQVNKLSNYLSWHASDLSTLAR